MKKIGSILLAIAFTLSGNVLMACPVCDQNQPKALQGISHGVGPQSQWDMWIVIAAAIIVAAALALSIKYLWKPNEKDPEHIKNLIISRYK